MWSFLRNFFQQIFGKPEEKDILTPQNPIPTPDTTPDPTEKEETEAPISTSIPEGATVLLMQRKTASAIGIVGTLQLNGETLAQTLENVSTTTQDQALPVGNYLVKLRKEGGIHSTYSINLGDAHKGMLQIVAPDQQGFRYIKMGNEAQYAYGSILVGKELEEYEDKSLLTFTESVYQKVYNQIYPLLENGKEVYLQVEG
ncbi:MAG: DUF5675 family protein [Bacteroidota bacterium]